MDEATLALTLTTSAVFIVFLIIFIWCLRSKQFTDVEEPKYRILENNEDAGEDDDKGG